MPLGAGSAASPGLLALHVSRGRARLGEHVAHASHTHWTWRRQRWLQPHGPGGRAGLGRQEEAWPGVEALDAGGVRPAPPTPGAGRSPLVGCSAGLYSGWGPTLARAQISGRPTPALQPWADRLSPASSVSIARCGCCHTGLSLGLEEANRVGPLPSGCPRVGTGSRLCLPMPTCREERPLRCGLPWEPGEVPRPGRARRGGPAAMCVRTEAPEESTAFAPCALVSQW